MWNSDTIDNSADTLDSRAIENRIDELDSEREDLQTALEEAQAALEGADEGENPEDLQTAVNDARKALTEWDEEDEGKELRNLKAFKDEAEGYCDWLHGTTFIRADCFEDHARKLAEELHGDAVSNAAWPFSCIDWTKAANDLKPDYSTAEFDGVTYYYRG